MRSFKSNEEIYSFVNEIMVLAKANSDYSTAQLIQDAIDQGGFLPTERLGELGLALRTLIKRRDARYLSPLRRDIGIAISAINKALNDANRFL